MKRVVFVLVACLIIVLLAALLLPLSQRRIPMNHMRAAHWTRQLTTSLTAHTFTVSAVPISAGTTGELAFCANEEGVLWYANGASSDECLRARRSWTKTDPFKD